MKKLIKAGTTMLTTLVIANSAFAAGDVISTVASFTDVISTIVTVFTDVIST